MITSHLSLKLVDSMDMSFTQFVKSKKMINCLRLDVRVQQRYINKYMLSQQSPVI